MIYATFDRLDICGAHLALENDWNVSGILQERRSNWRREESTGSQLRRMGYRPAGDACCSFEHLENDNQRAIYCNALDAFGMNLDKRDPSHAAILNFKAAS